MIDAEFLAILRCPLHPDAGPLTVKGHYLVCAECGRGYPVEDGIPRMLPESGVPAEELETIPNE